MLYKLLRINRLIIDRKLMYEKIKITILLFTSLFISAILLPGSLDLLMSFTCILSSVLLSFSSTVAVILVHRLSVTFASSICILFYFPFSLACNFCVCALLACVFYPCLLSAYVFYTSSPLASLMPMSCQLTFFIPMLYYIYTLVSFFYWLINQFSSCKS